MIIQNKSVTNLRGIVCPKYWCLILIAKRQIIEQFSDPEN